MATQTQAAPETEKTVPHPRYEPTSRACFDSQSEVARAWAEGKYPAHNEGVLYSSDNFEGHHHEDGAGTLWHYNTREAIRTESGLIIDNTECWASGFAYCSAPPGADYRLPLSGIEAHTESGTAVFRGRRTGTNAYRITSVMSEEDPRSGAYGRWHVVTVDGHDGAVGVGRDRTARNGGQFTVDLPPFIVMHAEEVGPRRAIVQYLRPDAVSAAMHETEAFPDGLPVLPSDEYRKYNLTGEEAKAHREAGGKTAVKSCRFRSDRTVNYQMCRADLQGSVIVRQGEYFFVPVPSEPTGFDPMDLPGAEKTRWALGSHKHERPAIRAEAPPGKSRETRLFVRGRVGHTRRDHHMINLGDTWHEAHESPVGVHQVGSRTD